MWDRCNLSNEIYNLGKGLKKRLDESVSAMGKYFFHFEKILFVGMRKIILSFTQQVHI